MVVLGIDIGSSAVKAGVLRGRRIAGEIARVGYETTFTPTTAEVPVANVERAVADALKELGRQARSVDVIAFSTMAPSWVAMDRRGRALTPLVTHQDRRSIDEAREIERRVGKGRHLRLAGNRPFPGGISSTTAAWFVKHRPAIMKGADLVGHLSTYLHRLLCGVRVTDPSNASFTGLYRTLTLGGWAEELCEAVGIGRSVLPEVRESHEVVGRVTTAGARRFGLREGTAVLAGCMDTSAAMLLAGAEVGQLLNVAGTTDVLALCTDRPRAHERLLTRALGVGRRWLSVANLASAGSTLDWVRRELFRELSETAFRRLVGEAGRTRDANGVTFQPYLAGDRTSIEQPAGAFQGLTLATTRQQMLAAVVEALAQASAARLELLAVNQVPMKRRVFVSGGVQGTLGRALHRHWAGRWEFRSKDEATLLGLARLAELTKG